MSVVEHGLPVGFDCYFVVLCVPRKGRKQFPQLELDVWMAPSSSSDRDSTVMSGQEIKRFEYLFDSKVILDCCPIVCVAILIWDVPG